MTMALNRRQLIKYSGVGLFFLGGGVYFNLVEDADNQAAFFSNEEHEILSVILPSIIPSLASHAESRRAFIKMLDDTLLTLPLEHQLDFQALMKVLGQPILRALLGGIWTPWHQAKRACVDRMLERWRNSPLEALNRAYNGLSQLCTTLYYGQQEHWRLSGYQGPSADLQAALGR